VCFYSKLAFSSRLLNNVVVTEDNVALDDRVINDAMKNLFKKVSMTECTAATYACRDGVKARKPIVSIASVLCEF